ncbi:MAG: hypothetical protein ACHREM_17700 [Polyangiales bacterium]
MSAIRIARVLVGLPAGALAHEAAVSERELRRIERGEVEAKGATLRALDEALVRLIQRRLAEGLADDH